MKKFNLKSLLLAGLLAITVAAVGMPADSVSAETMKGDSKWSVTFTSANKMESNFKTKDIDDVIKGMQPGDTAEITLKLSNANAKTTNWYMENKVLHSLEDRSANNDTRGGAYTYKLTYKGADGKTKTLFDSDTVGGDDVSVAGEGLNEATDSLDEWFYLDTLASGKGGQIDLKVSLEGETQGNDYQDTLADLQMNFAVELPSPTPTGTTGTPTPGTSTRPSVRTGDDNQPILYLVLSGVAGLILLILAIYSVRSRRAERVVDNQEEFRNRKGGR